MEILPPPSDPSRAHMGPIGGGSEIGPPRTPGEGREPPRRPPEPPPEGGPAAGPPQGSFTSLTWRRDPVALGGAPSPETPRGPPPERRARAQGLLTPLTWRSDHVAPTGQSPPKQGPLTALTWRPDHVTLRGPSPPQAGPPAGPPQGPFTPLTWHSDHEILREGPPQPPRAWATGRPRSRAPPPAYLALRPRHPSQGHLPPERKARGPRRSTPPPPLAPRPRDAPGIMAPRAPFGYGPPAGRAEARSPPSPGAGITRRSGDRAIRVRPASPRPFTPLTRRRDHVIPRVGRWPCLRGVLRGWATCSERQVRGSRALSRRPSSPKASRRLSARWGA